MDSLLAGTSPLTTTGKEMRIVLANGCFDPFHVGHLYHLQAARRLGDVLVVSVTRDWAVTMQKGLGRPVFKEKDRCSMLRALAIVDDVVLVDSAAEALRKVRPQVFVKGGEYRGRINELDEQYCRKNGIKIAFTDEATYSSTKLLNHYK